MDPTITEGRTSFIIRQATLDDTASVVTIVHEAAKWLEDRGIPLWRSANVNAESFRADVAAGLFFIAFKDADPAGTFKFQLDDTMFWPEMPVGDAAYIHRFAVRRAYAGGDVSAQMMSWSLARARSLGKKFVRLDCEANRPKLRAVYEGFGFRFHSDKHLGQFHVARYEYALT